MIVCPFKIIVLIFYTYMHLRGEVKDESDIKDPTDDEEPGLTSLIWPQNLKLQEKTIAFSAIGWSVFVMVKCGCDILGCSSAKYTKYSYCEMLHYPSILDAHL